ncbi:MAG: OST-HTH/LOTUS domain-containing protein [Betaproteobacteria bacterium]|nr:OST-HTH/LOTUS domain-containing protein [Betaproteobacteria bacterium]
MSKEIDLIQIKDDVFREIGKNILLLQQVERLLKLLVGHGRIEGATTSLEATRTARIARTEMQTLGMLVGEFAADVLGPEVESDPCAGNANEARLSFSFRIEGDSAFHDEQKIALSKMVEQRNELVHHFVAKWDWKSATSMQDAYQHLILLREQTEAQRAFLANTWLGFQETVRAHAAFLASDEAAKQFELAWLQQSKVVNLLREVAIRFERPDGWIAIATAGKFVRDNAGEDLDRIKERYGFRTLRELIAGVGLFELREEPTDKGTREVFRLIVNDVDPSNFYFEVATQV